MNNFTFGVDKSQTNQGGQEERDEKATIGFGYYGTIAGGSGTGRRAYQYNQHADHGPRESVKEVSGRPATIRPAYGERWKRCPAGRRWSGAKGGLRGADDGVDLD